MAERDARPRRAPRDSTGGGLGSAGFPNTRMGAAWKMRAQYARARELVVRQDAWDAACVAGDNPGEPRPGWKADELYVESIAALLRGEAKLHNHCYQVRDTSLRV